MINKNISAKFVQQNKLISLLILKLLKSGKKSIARRIVYCSLDIISKKTNKNPEKFFETALHNLIPKIGIKTKNIKSSIYQVPIEIKRIQGVKIALNLLLKATKNSIGLNMAEKLSNEIMEAYKSAGSPSKHKKQTQNVVGSKVLAKFQN